MMQDTKEDRIILAKLSDECLACERENRIISGDFLDMRMQGIAAEEFKRSGIRFFFDGGYEGAERRCAVFLPDWAEPENYRDEEPLKILRVSYRPGGKELSHRDFLGSILGLGLTRAKIGDIIVYSGGADIVIKSELADFLTANYFKAGRTELSLSIVPVDQLNLSEIKTETLTDTLASLRVDAFVASAYRCSRGKAQEAVRQGLVFLNNAQCLKPDAELCEGDVVVLRGKGKCVLESIGGTTRKDRTFVTIKRYI